MSLTYDFDIFDVIPDAAASGSQLDNFLSDIGFRPKQENATVALFRDVRTAEALRNAPPALRDYFVACGFGLNTYMSGAPSGCYPAKDEAARLALILRLAQNASRFDLPPPEHNAEGGDVFRLGAFLEALECATPVDIPDPVLAVDHSAGVVSGIRRALPALFETDPITEIPDAQDAGGSPRRKFWQNRFFRIGTAAILVLGATQLATSPVFSVFGRF